jgi:hypothetical protein
MAEDPLVQTVRPGESIAAAIGRARPGTHVVVEPGEYREALALREAISVTSRVPGGAVLRLPASADAAAAAVVARQVSSGLFAGFRIVGDAATPLGIGILARDASVWFVDIEIVGASEAAVDVAGTGTNLVGLHVHDNPGLGLLVRESGTPRIVASSFDSNGRPAGGAPVLLDEGARPHLHRNRFGGLGPEDIGDVDPRTREGLPGDNVFQPPQVRGGRNRSQQSAGRRVAP